MTGGPNDTRNGAVPPRLTGAAWLTRPEARAVFAALSGGGYEARAVGGAVRNALLGEPVRDLDIATPARPEDVMRLAKGAGLTAIPTGIEHGTVTIVSGHIGYEVTTLRRDIETFGRHARVTFTTDWAEDARRRDFTMNALYCDPGGIIHDPLQGFSDLVARRVRFIGEARDRIREDYLRILRFFRFTAEYSEDEPESHGLAACAALKDGIAQLSGERVRAELLRLLAARRAPETIAVMENSGILAAVLPGGRSLEAYNKLRAIERSLDLAADPLVGLCALAVSLPGAALALRDRLRLSNSEYERIARMAMPDPAFDPAVPEREAKAFIYRYGPEAFSDGAVVAWARSGDSSGDERRRQRLSLPARWKAPELPVRGADVLALGVPAGPDVGRVLGRFEEWWIGEDFPCHPDQLAAELARLAVVTKS